MIKNAFVGLARTSGCDSVSRCLHVFKHLCIVKSLCTLAGGECESRVFVSAF